VLGQVLHIVRSALVAEVRASAVATVVCAIVNAAASFWVIPIYGLRGAAATTLASFVLYFLAMTAGVRPILPGTVASMRPWILILGLAVVPFALLLDSSPLARALLALSLGAVALWSRRFRLPRAAAYRCSGSGGSTNLGGGAFHDWRRKRRRTSETC
jgi:O-antigen/teichoic acid export membrane protein